MTNKIIELYKSGMTISEISKEVSLGMNSVYKVLKENGVERRKAVKRKIMTTVECPICKKTKNVRIGFVKYFKRCSKKCYWEWLKNRELTEEKLNFIKELSKKYGYKKGHAGYKGNTGKKMSEEAKQNMSIARKLKPTRYWLNKKRLDMTGEKCKWWKGGITPLNKKLRTSAEYKNWRKSVFERDNYTCVFCKDKRGGNLNADHIKQFAFYPELRFDINNGRTLCVPCHKKTPTYSNRKI